jgi:hypothetical protein
MVLRMDSEVVKIARELSNFTEKSMYNDVRLRNEYRDKILQKLNRKVSREEWNELRVKGYFRFAKIIDLEGLVDFTPDLSSNEKKEKKTLFDFI